MEYKYELVQFGNNENEVEKLIAVVPRGWIFLNPATGTAQCKYMPGPFDEENWLRVNEMVKNSEPPSDYWPTYLIELLGSATCYEEAETLVRALDNQRNFYSTDIEREDEKLFSIDVSSTALSFQAVGCSDINSKCEKNRYKEKVNQIKPETNREHEERNRKAIKPQQALKEAGEGNSQYKPFQVIPNSNASSSINYQSCSSHSQKGFTVVSSENAELDVLEIRNRRKTNLEEEEGRENNASNNFADCIQMSLHQNGEQGDAYTTCLNLYDSLSKQIGELTSQMVGVKNLSIQIHENQTKMMQSLTANAGENDNMDLSNEDETMSFLCETRAQFEILDEKIKMDPHFRQRTARIVLQTIRERLSLARNIGEILRVFLTKDLAAQMNLKRASRLKDLLLIKTSLYKVITETLITKLFKSMNTPLIENFIATAASNVLRNSKFWAR